ncbi:cytochrome c oxidase subunit 3 [Hymenobacter sp. BT175]|uniref:cytochrome c oxidase subunit 3 n=1 Tax=Hymenobacter translucens TaxID=2886507 RepID=UPI001D0DE1A4|nr:cytochrome c oxidase subunit 3 [Hymenobacter translucens]MCC2547057.1 cytochrome c oxidase subunit 3 [Hymenobacter translucens]
MHPSETLTHKEPGTGLHPMRLVLILLIISIVMMFAAFTSGYIVRREEGNWLEYALPGSMLYTSIIIALSSATVQWAWVSARKDNVRQVQIALVLTMLLGVAFLYGQWQVWGELVQNKVFFGGTDSNPAGSFTYVLMGVHGFHLITGLIFLLIVLGKSFRYQVHSRQMLAISNCSIYWHFLGGLWLYLYLFLLLNH